MHLVTVVAAEVVPVLLPVFAVGSLFFERVPFRGFADARIVLVGIGLAGRAAPEFFAVEVVDHLVLAVPQSPDVVFVEIVFDGDAGGDVALVAVPVEGVGIGFPVVIGQMAVALSGADILAGLHDVDLVFVAPGVVGRCLAGEPEGVVHARRGSRTEPAFDVDVVLQRFFKIDIARDPFDLFAPVDLADVEAQLSVAHPPRPRGRGWSRV